MNCKVLCCALLVLGLAPSLAVSQVNRNFLINDLELRPELMLRQKTPEFLKDYVNSELSFIYRVCQPNEQQMKAIVAEAEKAFDLMNEMVNGWQNQGRLRGQLVVLGPNQERLTEMPHARVRRDAAKYLKPLVSAEQYEAYEQESRQRQAGEYEAAIELLIDRADTHLALSDEQKQLLREEMRRDGKLIDIEHTVSQTVNAEEPPSALLQVIASTITEGQKKAWEAYKSRNASLSVGHGQTNFLGEKWIQ